MTAVGKWIGGGYTITALGGGKKEIMDVYDPKIPNHIAQSCTFNGNKLGMAVGIESVKLFDKKAVDYVNELAKELHDDIESAIKKYNLRGFFASFAFYKRSTYKLCLN